VITVPIKNIEDLKKSIDKYRIIVYNISRLIVFGDIGGRETDNG